MAYRTSCAVCLDLKGDPFDRGLNIKGDHFSRVDIKEVGPSRDRGCPGCVIISWILEPYMDKVFGKSAEVRLRLRGDHYLCYSGTRYPREVIAELEVMATPRDIDDGHIWERKAQQACRWPHLPAGPAISGDTGSDIAVSRVLSWLSKCKKNHPECNAISTPLPTRVLQIDGPNSIRLYNSNGETAPYACLSHCWGRRNMVQTSTLNLQDRLAGIPWDKLPPTFQQAVTFSYKLGLRYLWIDSLCIIQDSIDDWQHEGSRMCAIYENSYITLAASVSPSAYHGCFMKSGHASRIRTFWNSANEPYEVHCRVPLPQRLSIPEPPLQQRGWVFQERMLSKRTVYFMYDELYWECMRGSTCECQNHSPGQIFGPKHNLYQKLHDSENVEEIEATWQGIVEEYTRKKLTYPADIFPALQGLAKLASPRMGSYLAGHWETTLAYGLCWYVQRDEQWDGDIPEWRAPTWSWASALAPVCWQRWPRAMTDKTCFAVVGARTVPKGADPMGQLRYGEVTLRGKCLPGEIAPTKTIDPWSARPKVVNGRLDPTKPNLSTAKLYLFENWKQRLDDDQGEPWACYPNWDRNFKCERNMRVLAMRMHVVSADAGTKEEFWLVLMAKDDAKRIYERLGLMQLSPSLLYYPASKPGWDSRERLEEMYDSAAREMEITVI